ncbi:magnesium/cobalt transporter CorA [Balneolaceae bacterium ANBcel3]|nr:magnesium/cobalt transporter CorA [Balneolaceae bacterium ANBcel3]
MKHLMQTKAREKMGLPPGSPVFTGRKKMNKTFFSEIRYDKEHFSEKEDVQIEEIQSGVEDQRVTWITVTGLHETEKIQGLTEWCHIHPLIYEDILNIHQRPKLEIFDEYLFLTFKAINYQSDTRHMSIDQISLILTGNRVILFQEEPVPFFEVLKKRLRESRGRIRERKPDYLLYAIIDIVVDHYFVNLELIGDHMDAVEEKLKKDPSHDVLNEIYAVKREVLFMRKAVWPLREVINKLEKTESSLIHSSTLPYIRDIYDHIIQVIDGVETSRELLSGMQDLYLSSLSNRMNQVMKMLTIIATIFIPLTFIAGVYGMNFEYMPELNWQYGYFYILGIMLAVVVGMLAFFRYQKWL